MIKKSLQEFIIENLDSKIIFIGGARKVGKTTLVKNFAEKHFSGNFLYLNWIKREDRKIILKEKIPVEKKLIIFDELFKYRNWEEYLIKIFSNDTLNHKFIVISNSEPNFSSGLFEGKYYYLRVHPLTFNELLGFEPDYDLTIKNSVIPACPESFLNRVNNGKDSGQAGMTPKTDNLFKEIKFRSPTTQNEKEKYQKLKKFGGFPEVYFSECEKTLKRWKNDKLDNIIKEDIREVENIRDLSALQILAELLPNKVGSLFSLNSLRAKLGVAYKTIASWGDILERFYYHFKIEPYKINGNIKSIRKETKLYLWDWSDLEEEAARFENLIALHLLKFCHYINCKEKSKAMLYYLRDIEKREVDFLVTLNEVPWFCVEASGILKKVPQALKYFKKKLDIPYAFNVVDAEDTDFIEDDIHVLSASKFLTALA